MSHNWNEWMRRLLSYLITEFYFKVNPELIDEEGKDSGLYSWFDIFDYVVIWSYEYIYCYNKMVMACITWMYL